MRLPLGLAVFTRVNDGSINLVSRHPWWSLTWTWLVNIGIQRGNRRLFRLWWFHKQAGCDLFWAITVRWYRQDAMPHVMKYRQRYG